MILVISVMTAESGWCFFCYFLHPSESEFFTLCLCTLKVYFPNSLIPFCTFFCQEPKNLINIFFTISII